ncbi:hypothetical protein EU527_13195 [Candidatus Thorarchaeota archaeon]|nr:MAG: hypothetical protein EU527_13195 [Candidatus Thorarchaeota archaeon]
MPAHNNDHVSMAVWCPLIPPEELDRFTEWSEDLRNISQAYEDWLSSMRGKSFVGTDIGVLLDRIRILMINIGIACAMNRALAESVQTVISEYLRVRALSMIEALSGDSKEKIAVKETLTAFFSDLRFTRDIFPEEDVKGVIPIMVSLSSDSSHGLLGRFLGSKSKRANVDQEKTLQAALIEGSNILKKLYMRLLSPDPWGTY